MDQTLKKIQKLTKFMRKNGLIHLKDGDLELSLSPAAIELPEPPHPATDSNANPVTENPYSEEDALFWSSPGLEPTEGH